MLPFDYKKALKGNRLCNLKNGMYAILYANINDDIRIPNEHESPLLGVVLNSDKVSYSAQWTLSGIFRSNSDLNIIGILNEFELDAFDNSKVLKEAFKSSKKVTWDENPFGKPVTVTECVSNVFVLSFGIWSCKTSGDGIKNLRTAK